MKTTLDFSKLAKQVACIDGISKEKNWSYYYDDELDSLYFSPKKVGDDFLLFSLTDEFSVFVDKDSNLGGVFIEYYMRNLSSHEEKFKPFKNLFQNKKRESKKDKQNVVLLSEVLKAELLSGIINRNSDEVFMPAV